jgi:hypothetical protein
MRIRKSQVEIFWTVEVSGFCIVDAVTNDKNPTSFRFMHYVLKDLYRG